MGVKKDISKLTWSERTALRRKKKLPKLLFIFLEEREGGMVAIPLTGWRVGDKYLVVSEKLGIVWRLGLPPFKAIIKSGHPNWQGVVLTYVPDRDLFYYLTNVTPSKKHAGKYEIKAVDEETGEETTLLIDKPPIYLFPKFEVTEVELQKLSQEAEMRRSFADEFEETQKQEEALRGFLAKYMPIIIAVIGAVAVGVIVMISANAITNVMREASAAMLKMSKTLATVAMNHTATVAKNAATNGAAPW